MKNIKEYLENQENENIERKENSTAVPLCLIFLSILVIVLSSTPLVASTALSLVLVFLFLIVLVIGVIMMFAAKGKNKYIYFYRPNGAKMKHWSIYLDDNAYRTAQGCFTSKDFSKFPELNPTDLSNHCLEIYGTEGFYALQLVHFEMNNDVQADCELAVVENADAQAVGKFVNR